MLRTYEAVLNGDHVEWKGEAPHLDAAARVHITVLESAPPLAMNRAQSDGRAMAAALESLAKQGTFKDIVDPVEWQREIRKDRPLPGRED
jgi:hypothetical protein